MKNLLLATLLAAALPASAVEIIAHRGASYDAPENTLAAFKLGYEHGADGCELDIHLTKDGQIIVSHDANTERTTGIKRRIAESTLAELSALDAGQWGAWAGKGFKEPLPTLASVLKLVPADRKLVIEIKCGAEVLPELERVLAASGVPVKQIALIGFGYETMRATKARLPQYTALWLVSSDSKTKQFPPVEQLITQTRAAGLDGLNLNYGFPLNADFVAQVRAAGLKLWTWTVDDAAVARAEQTAGVEAITTNRPRWLREQLRAAH